MAADEYRLSAEGKVEVTKVLLAEGLQTPREYIDKYKGSDDPVVQQRLIMMALATPKPGNRGAT
jgi:hypothetical protein